MYSSGNLFNQMTVCWFGDWLLSNMADLVGNGDVFWVSLYEKVLILLSVALISIISLKTLSLRFSVPIEG